MRLPLAHAPTVSLKKVTDTETAPFRYICRIGVTVGKSDLELATGLLVGPKHVLTAAHPLVDGGSLVRPEQVTVTPALNGSDAPFGNSGALDIVTSKGFSPGDEVTMDDFALIETEEDFSDLDTGPGFWGTSRHAFDDRGSVVGAIPGWRPGRFKVNISGYPLSKGRDTQWHSYDDTINLSKLELSGLSPSEQPLFLFFKNAIEQGMSGSPVWVTRHHSFGGRFAFAIVLGMKEIHGKRYAAGRVIDRELKEFIAKHTRTKLRGVGHEIKLGGAMSKDNVVAHDETELEFETFDNEESFELLDFEWEAPCPTPCPSPSPPKGQFSAPNEKGHRWFTPEYRQYPSNLWHLAKVVRDRMLAEADFDERKVPTEGQIRSAIRSHPCNAHFTKSKPMFMPRFGTDRCTGTGQYYGSIYIPFKFDGRTPDTPTPTQPDIPGPDFILPDAMLDDGVSSGEKLVAELEFGRRCRETDRPVIGSDDRTRVGDTGQVPYRWVCKLLTVFPPRYDGGRPVRHATGFILDGNRLITCAHVLDTDIGTPDFIIFIPGFNKEVPTDISALDSDAVPFGTFVVDRYTTSGASNFHIAGEWRAKGDHRFDYGVIDIRGRKQLRPKSLPGSPLDAWTSVSASLATVSIQALITGTGARARSTSPGDVMKFVRSEGTNGLFSSGYPGDRPCAQMLVQDRVRKTLFPDNSDHNLIESHLDAISGMSGAPVWVERNVKIETGRMRKQRVLVGIHKGGITPLKHLNGGIRVSSVFVVVTPLLLRRLTRVGLLLPA